MQGRPFTSGLAEHTGGFGIGLLDHPGRSACTFLTLAYFVSVWLTRGLVAAPFVLTLLYLFLVLPRWSDLGLKPVIGIQAPALLLDLVESLNKSPFAVAALLHFTVLLPTVFLCIAPLGLTLPRTVRFRRIGRVPFILMALPYFVLVYSQYSEAMNRTLSLLWTVVSSPIDKVPALAAVSAAAVPVVFANDRLVDIGASQWFRFGLPAAFVFRLATLLIAPLQAYVPLADATLSAGILALCLWPGRPDADRSDLEKPLAAD